MATILSYPSKSGSEQVYGIETMDPDGVVYGLPSKIQYKVYTLDGQKLFDDYCRTHGSWMNLFNDLRGLKYLDLHGWNTANCTSLYNAFYGCESLETINLSGWSGGNSLTTMYNCWYGCGKLKSLDLAGWNVSRVSSLASCFSSCFSLEKLDLDGWNTANCTAFTDMLTGVGSQATGTKIWVPSTFVATRASSATAKPFYSAPGSANVHIYTDAADATTPGWGTINASYTMHYNATYQDFLNA